MKKTKTNYLVKVGVLSAIAFILQLMYITKVANVFEVEFSDFPAIMGTLALGPVAGVLIELIKNLLHLPFTTTGGVGELANFVVNGILVLTVGLVYKFNKTKKGAVIALILGCIIMPLTAALVNYCIMVPLFMPDAPHEIKLNFALTTATPFNFVRAIVLSLITVYSYKRLSSILHR